MKSVKSPNEQMDATLNRISINTLCHEQRVTLDSLSAIMLLLLTIRIMYRYFVSLTSA